MTDDSDRLYERLLVLRSQSGDPTAFAELVERYQRRLRYYVRKLLREIHDPDSVLQEIWFDVFRALPRLSDVGAFRAWAYRIAHDRALQVLRKRRLAYKSLSDAEPSTATSADDICLTRDNAERVHAALEKLTLAHREVLVLRYLEDMEYAEIARVVGCETGTVRSRLHYAKQELRKMFERSSP